MLSKRRRTGSASAAKTLASSMASSSARGEACRGAQHTPCSSSMRDLDLVAIALALHLLTVVDIFARVDTSTSVNLQEGSSNVTSPARPQRPGHRRGGGF